MRLSSPLMQSTKPIKGIKMTPNQIISEIWNLEWYQVMKVAIYDDFILICKIWPIYILLLIGWILYLFLRHRKER